MSLRLLRKIRIIMYECLTICEIYCNCALRKLFLSTFVDRARKVRRWCVDHKTIENSRNDRCFVSSREEDPLDNNAMPSTFIVFSIFFYFLWSHPRPDWKMELSLFFRIRKRFGLSRCLAYFQIIQKHWRRYSRSKNRSDLFAKMHFRNRWPKYPPRCIDLLQFL